MLPFNLTYLFITHHLLVVKYISTKIIVMYLGKVVEESETEELFANPMHPYTFALLSGIPSIDGKSIAQRIVLEGDVPSPIDPPEGCRFHTRCPFAEERCVKEEPELENVKDGHKAACHRKYDVRKLIQDKYSKAIA